MVIIKQWKIKNRSGIIKKIVTLSRDKKTKTGTFRVTKPYCVDISQDIGIDRVELAQTYSKRFSKKTDAMKVINGAIK